jgi:hypothetical protein
MYWPIPPGAGLKKMPAVGKWAAAATIGLLSLAACTTTPITLSSQFIPPASTTWPALSPAARRQPGATPTDSCVLNLANVRDLRADPHAMGSIGARVVRAVDTTAWLRSSLQALERDSRIRIAVNSDSAGSGLNLGVDLLQAYVMTITTEKSTTVVLRTRYERQGSLIEEKTYRGANVSVNWTNGEAEVQSSFNTALAQILETMDRDILDFCGSAMPARS